jgi:thioredoxin-like negative regulator of GroEL
MEPMLEQLAREYRGRAMVAKYRQMNFVFIHTSWSITRKYGVYFVPTVLLLVDGQVRRRWFNDVRIWSYRRALDRALEEQASAGGAKNSYNPDRSSEGN